MTSWNSLSECNRLEPVSNQSQGGRFPRVTYQNPKYNSSETVIINSSKEVSSISKSEVSASKPEYNCLSVLCSPIYSPKPQEMGSRICRSRQSSKSVIMAPE